MRALSWQDTYHTYCHYTLSTPCAACGAAILRACALHANALLRHTRASYADYRGAAYQRRAVAACAFPERAVTLARDAMFGATCPCRFAGAWDGARYFLVCCCMFLARSLRTHRMPRTAHSGRGPCGPPGRYRSPDLPGDHCPQMAWTATMFNLALTRAAFAIGNTAPYLPGGGARQRARARLT